MFANTVKQNFKTAYLLKPDPNGYPGGPEQPRPQEPLPQPGPTGPTGRSN